MTQLRTPNRTDRTPDPQDKILRLERALHASHERFRNLIVNNADGMVVVGTDGMVRFMNPAAETLFGCKCGDCTGISFGIPITTCDRTEVDLPRAARPGTIAEMHVAETEWEGEPAYIASLRDVTDRKTDVEALKDADRRKDEFLAMLAHELRNPLSPIRNSIHLMRLDPKRSPASDRALEIAERQVKNLSRLVDDLLDVSRITRGKIKLEKEPVDLLVIAARAVESVATLMEAHDHDVSLSLGNRPARVDGDPTRLEQILSNLLNNAAKYTPNGGRIRLSVAQERDEVLVRVTDNGVGIAAEVLPSIFDLFAQDKRPMDRSQGGLGIGLTISRRLAEMHGGTLSAASKGKDQGSDFLLRLPALQAPAAPASSDSPPGATPSARAGRLRILIVEDQREAAEMLRAILQFWGHQVFVAYDGPTGLEAALKVEPDVALMDIGLPGMTGLEVANRLKQEPSMAKTLMIAVTGYGQDEMRRQSEEAGFSHHLVKPVNLATLESLLKQAKTESRARS